ncbi:TlpA disulfide reductase family protein [Prolixibacter sp. SD074]|jgi:peroxiredoxin|uniref:TlpA disulfide reductase family protein n=1 Tax=Prolixibacter sp. SD074 TaxID=2652391 RepID=UPI00126B500E|nr:TlpA disulfide reductase family protein [Prolixibacter sp. SD074]GET30763.1 hypothetical protein SD074_29650 [Prolixibacter sp. SD074]
MKKLFFAVAILFLLYSCSEKTNFSVSGTIDGAGGKMLYLNELKVSSQIPVDSMKVDNKGQFELKGNAAEPTFYLLKFNDHNFVTLLLDSTEQATVTGSYQNLPTDYSVKGSLGSKLVRELNMHYTNVERQLDSLSDLFNMHKQDANYESEREKWNDEYVALKNKHAEYLRKFVMDHPFSLASVMALYQKWDDGNFIVQDLHTMKVAASALSAMFPNSSQVKALHSNTLQIMRQENSRKMTRLIKDAGQNSPDITLPDTDGKEVSLSSMRGKYVLVQFWAGQDRDSRVMNPVLVANYQKYHPKGFDIYQVSIDTSRTAWTNAIKADHLNWTNVGDMKGSVQAVRNYNIQSIPSNYLLGKDGSILAKNLMGPALNNALEKYLK